MSRFFLGIDIGGSRIKAGLFDESGDLRGFYQISTKIYNPKPGWAEISPTEILSALPFVIRGVSDNADVSSKEISSIGFSSTCPTLVPIDKNGDLLSNAVMNFDQRAVSQAEEISDKIGDRYFSLTGNRYLSGAISAPGILWFKEDRPDIYENARVFGHITTYLTGKLTSNFVIDWTNASLTGLFDITRERDWIPAIFDELGLDLAKMPSVISPTKPAGSITGQWARALDLSEDVCIAPGSADTAALSMGVGVLKAGEIFISSGTSEIVSGVLDRPDFDNKFLNRTAIIGKKWLFHGPINTGGAAINWLKRIILSENDSTALSDDDYFKALTGLVKRSKIGSNGLLFLPYLQGERTPLWDSYARGIFFGISLYTNKSDFVRAVFESIGYALKNVFIHVEKMIGKQVEKIMMTGGGSKNSEWLKIKCDILGRKIFRLDFNEPTLFGAALAGGVASGCISGNELTLLSKKYSAYSVFEPDLSNHELYKEYYQKFVKLYETNKENFKNFIYIDENELKGKE
ncbi:MAG: FGGY family carbohydrate kinase [Actinobacteria bacterium]|nr:FGGY family carbohydrate kinase [Actinomycetota bacterium]